MKKEIFSRLAEATALISAVALSRLIPHLPNATLVSPVALYARSRFGPIGIMIPFLGLFATDLILGLYNVRLLASVYASFALVFLLGRFLTHESSIIRITSASVFGTTLFFLITNTAVWALSAWYPHTLTGLLACLAAGLPFYGYMLLGDCVGTLALFKAPVLACFRIRPIRMTIVPTR
ncbi:MAG: DUF6580 family putative transport protein [Patescibacteria group bacterium]